MHSGVTESPDPQYRYLKGDAVKEPLIVSFGALMALAAHSKAFAHSPHDTNELAIDSLIVYFGFCGASRPAIRATGWRA